MLRRIVPLVLGSLVFAVPAAAAPVLLDRLVALVEGQPIFRSEVTSKEALERMIDERLIAKEATRLHIEVYDAEVDAAEDLVAKKFGMTRPELLDAAKKQGLTEVGYREELRRQLLEAKWLRREQLSDEKGEKEALAKLRASAFVEVKW